MGKRIIAATLLCLMFCLTMLAVTACSSSYGLEEEDSFNMMVKAFGGDAAGASSAASYYESGAVSAAADSAADYDTSYMQEGGSALSAGAVASPERKIITTVDLQMESVQYDDTAQKIYEAVAAAGGYIEYSDITGNLYSTGQIAPTGFAAKAVGTPSIRLLGGDESYYRDGGPRRMYLTIRVPQSGLAGFLDVVEASGNVLSKQESAEDITLRYVDVQSHITALKTEQEQLISLLDRAETVEDMIKLQERLSEVRYQIESYESQLRVMENQVSYSTVNLHLKEVVVYTEPPVTNPTVGQRIANGFTRTLNDIGSFWTDQFVWLAVNSIYIVCTLAVLAVLFLLIRRYVKRHPIKAAAPTADAVAGDATVPEGPAVSLRWLDNFKRENLFRPPFVFLDRLLIIFTVLHGLTAFTAPFFDWLTSNWYPGTVVMYLFVLGISVFAILHILSYLTIPLSVVALIYRWIILRRTPVTEKPAFKSVGTCVLFLLQLVFAVVGWSAWQYMVL